jgi:hypothetical protein
VATDEAAKHVLLFRHGGLESVLFKDKERMQYARGPTTGTRTRDECEDKDRDGKYKIDERMRMTNRAMRTLEDLITQF